MIVLILMTASSCSNHHSFSVLDNEDYNEANGFNRADSIISDVGDTRDHQRTLHVIDSLEQAGELSLVKIIFYRTITYNLLGQYRTSLRLYSQLATIDVKSLTTQVDFESYIYAYNNYVRVLCDMRRYDRALREANNADRKLKAAGYDGFTDHHDIAQIIGECQLYLGQKDLAAKSFQKSLKGVHTRLTKHHAPLDYRECQKTMNAIVKVYLQTGLYNEATPWIQVQDSLYDAANVHPQRDSVFIDEMKADINYSKALLARALGHNDDAERAFAAYQTTHLAKQLGSIINSNEYLMKAHRYEEAARNYQLLDKFLLDAGYKADFENFGRYMIPKYRSNILAGHRDSALYVATVVAEYFDTALVRQRRIDADLLTTFYDTEGKERQIAEQRAELSQQRLLTVAILLIVFIIFFLVYTLQRRRAFKKLDATNRQLILANERAEESSRLKTKFIQQISHEVRTPLNVLSGFSQILAAPDIKVHSDELKNISEKIMENSERITQLIDKMLDLNQANSNMEIECNDTVCPADIARQAINSSGILQAEHLKLLLQWIPQVETSVFVTNQKSAVKALAMLLDNAAKFTHPRMFKNDSVSNNKQRVTISISVTQDHVAFAVEDTGIGIPPEEAENIFNEFVKLDEYSDGAGIGLSIARSLIRQIGGDINLDTYYTPGARFVITLPRRTRK